MTWHRSIETAIKSLQREKESLERELAREERVADVRHAKVQLEKLLYQAKKLEAAGRHAEATELMNQVRDLQIEYEMREVERRRAVEEKKRREAAEY